ncbi:scopoletin glucosyltransferase-like [Euphorbia lathyris]|uniref:scopoletin glucosyltransferase-like n=1 Tax=Euphorbia lathyris TaxID=212925 RepID=UPI003313FFA8
MGSFDNQLHIFFFPFMAHGHTIPTVDMAKLFASRGAKTTIITTPLNAPSISKSIQTSRNLGFQIDIRILKFPSAEAGLPEGCENLDFVVSNGREMLDKFAVATTMLQEQLEKLLQECHPDCLVADMFFPWATDAASKFGIPRIVFHGISFFSMCAAECIRLYEPHKKVSSDSETFVIPSLPGEIKLTRNQLPDILRQDPADTALTRLMKGVKESELKSFGVIVNSFYELESDYADFYRKELGRRAWHIGPLSLCNRAIEDKAQSGNKASINEHECLKWLYSKKPDSVVYICFGTLTNFTAAQLKEIAVALEASGQQFIWVVRREKKEEREGEEEEERMEGKGLIIRGWAPQVLILEHEAIGGFVTHCGWNSTLEGITAGKPMVTWPVAAEQFYNEKFVTHVLKIGIEVGVKHWVKFHGDDIKSEAIEKAIRGIMEGEDAEEMRSRARNFGMMAREAVEKDGSSDSDFNALIDLIKPRN